MAMNTICAQARCHQGINIPLDRQAEEQFRALLGEWRDTILQSQTTVREHHLVTVCDPQLSPGGTDYQNKSTSGR
jgi:hypothetical protein